MPSEFHELRVWLILVGCMACVFNIGQTVWFYYGESLCNVAIDLVSRLSS